MCGFPTSAQDIRVRVNGDSKWPVDVNGCLSIYTVYTAYHLMTAGVGSSYPELTAWGWSMHTVHTYITTDSAPVCLSIWWSTSFVNKTPRVKSYLNPLTCGNNWFLTWRGEFTVVWQSIIASEWGANSRVCGRSQSDRANRIIISEHQRCNPEITRLDTFHLLAVPTELMN